MGLSGSSCRVLSGLFVFQFWASGDSLARAVVYCLIFLSFNFGPQRTFWLQLSGIVRSLRLSISGLRELSGSSCRVLSDLCVCEFRASGDSLAPAVVYCLVFLSVNFGPQGTLWLQLSGIV